MLRIGRWGLLVFVALSAGCGLYGEGGFSGKDPLSAPRFIEDVDEVCDEINTSIDDESAVLLRRDAPADDATDDAIGDYRDAIDELVDELPDHYGPEDLEQQRDAYIDALEQADDALDEAGDALDDGDEDALREHLTAATERLAQVERAMRTAGFTVCGVPRPTD